MEDVRHGAGRPKEGEENRPDIGQLAQQHGKSRSAAYRLMELSQKLEPYPKLASLVDQKKIPQYMALEMVQNHTDVLHELEAGMITPTTAKNKIKERQTPPPEDDVEEEEEEDLEAGEQEAPQTVGAAIESYA